MCNTSNPSGGVCVSGLEDFPVLGVEIAGFPTMCHGILSFITVESQYNSTRLDML